MNLEKVKKELENYIFKYFSDLERGVNISQFRKGKISAIIEIYLKLF